METGHGGSDRRSAGAGARRLVLAALALAALAGCASPQLARVKPWQREYLADPLMDPNRDPLGTALSDHVYFSREAAQGGRGVGGAGCGCN
ncbi:MAG: DUF4266 domain-containing protein [Opitutaceae bacterium]|jgi:hypothetical protein